MRITRRYTMQSQKEPAPNQNIIELLGINQKNSQSSRQPTEFCQKCFHYERVIYTFQQKQKKSEKRQKKLRNLLASLQIQNGLVIESTDSAVRDFETYIIKLQNQIFQRDQIITKLAEDIDYITNMSNELTQTIQSQKQKIKQIESLHKEQIQMNNNQLKEVKAHIFKQVSQKATFERKNKQQTRKWEIQKFKLKQQIKSLEELIQSKQKLIKNLSNSNNQLRIQLIQIKSKTQIQNLTWDTDKRKSFINDMSQDFNRQLKKQNDQLKLLNFSLQSQLQLLIRQAEDMETTLVKTKLERDVFKNSLTKQRSKSMGNEPIYGSIQQNKTLSRYKTEGQPSRSRIQMAGHIRFNNKQMNSLKTSVSNQILEEDSDKS